MLVLSWPKKFGTRLGLIAIILLLPTLLVVGESLRVLAAWRADTDALVWMGRGRKQASDYLHLVQRLGGETPPKDGVRDELALVMQRVDERHGRLDEERRRWFHQPRCDAQLAAQAKRWRAETRPALNQLLAADGTASPRASIDASVAARVSNAASSDLSELWSCINATQEAASRDLARLQFLQVTFLIVALLGIAGLVLLARRLSLSVRELTAHTERVARGDLVAAPVLTGDDELARVGASFSSTVSRIRAYFESEHEALQQRLQAVTTMNSQLASGASGFMAAVDPQAVAQSAAGIIGSIPPTSSPGSDAVVQVPQRRSIRVAGAPEVPMRLLLVDDDPEVLRGFSRVLGAKGYQVTSAKRGKEALKALEGQAFDVIVSDIAMPDMSGIQLLREVRARDLLVPVVLITGSPEVKTAAEAVEFGAFQYLVKPVQKESLLRVIEHAGRVHEVARTRQEVSVLLGQEASMAADRAGLEGTFDRALQGLWMAYQPIVDVRSQRIFGYEALLRSTEPSLPHPGAVIDAAERLGRLPLLGQTVRARASEPMLSMADGPLLFVNLHVRDLVDPSLSDPSAPLSRIAKRVVLEITERVSLDEVRDARLRVAALREMGFRIAVDDMGAGYAGLSSFAVLEPEIVKLDMSLVRDVHQSPVRQKVIRSMAGLSEDMGIQVIAEGVETRAERETLERLGCTLLQGYLFAKPGRPFPLVAW